MVMRLKMAIFAALLGNFTNLALADEFAHHPKPQKPLFIDESWYPTLKAQLTPPPSKGDKQQVADEAELHQLQKSRSAEDCARAKREVHISLENFFGPPDGPLDSRTAQALTPFFKQILNDGDFFIQKLKVDFPRQRPFLYVKDLSPCVAKEATGAYPSGHAAISKLYALILDDIYPGKKARFDSLAEQVAHDRVLSGMHHGSDIQEGKKVAVLFYEQIKKSKAFIAELEKARIQAHSK